MLERFRSYLVNSGLSPATVVNYVADLRAFLRWSERARGESASPFDLTSADVEQFRQYLNEMKKHTPATVNRRLQAVRKFYRVAVQEGWATANPAESVALVPETVSARSRTLTSTHIDRFLAAVRSGRRRWVDRDWAIMHVFLGAGLKLTELTQVRLTDVHVEGEEPYLSVRNVSGKPDRTVPLTPEVHEALVRYLAVRRPAPGVDYLFVNRDGRRLSTRSVQRLLRHYARAARVEELTTQALRYLYARQVYETSQNPETVARLLGHRHLATTIRFLQAAPDEEM